MEPCKQNLNNNEKNEHVVEPLVVDFIEHHDGASEGATSGTWSDVDANDVSY